MGAGLVMDDDFIARRIEVNGIVQGVGFRPFVYQLATGCGLRGEVANTAAGVSIFVQGSRPQVDRFSAELLNSPPPLARITDVSVQPEAIRSVDTFAISKSRGSQSRTALISPDVSICDDCLRELLDPSDRRFRYPFINCTNCGPRYTIIDNIPYDRPFTSMRHFTMCPECQAEYDNPLNRRFHAQPNACPVCGPSVSLCRADGTPIAADDPVLEATRLLEEGQILAVKGLGGFHLAVDAASDEAVRRLRRRKRREEKPLAVMARSLDHIRAFAGMTPEDEARMTSSQRPVVLLKKRSDGIQLAESVSPGNRYYGVMLPYTPLHVLLLQCACPALVMTSGNLSNEPIAIDNADAVDRLAGIADAFLTHNRDIYLRSDDSITVPVAGRSRFIRRSRGYVPFPVFLGKPHPSVLACGAELKNTVCLTKADQAFLSQHIGDLENLATYAFFELTVSHMKRILDIEPKVFACDLHPDYLSTRYARQQMGEEAVAVQHHHAHIVSCMAENRVEEPVIGLAFDGTGLGTDGAIWGGEVLIADAAGFSRAAHLDYVGLPGGEAAIREPWRMALSYLYAAYGDSLGNLDLPVVRGLDEKKLALMVDVIRKRVNCPATSSMGRLFDGVAALIGLRDRVSFEGQAAMELEMLADMASDDIYNGVAWTDGDSRRIRLDAVIRGVVDDVLSGRSPARISGKFHRTLIRLFTRLCVELRNAHGLNRVALSGGVFQNSILLGGMIQSLEEKGFQVYSHTLVPANDGGICLGQAVAAAAMVERKHVIGE